MKKSVKKLALAAMLAAVAVVLLCTSSLFPTGRAAFAAVAGLASAAALIECGLLHAVLCFAASALLGLILAPDRTSAIMFAVFLGYYPVLKGIIEKKAGRRLTEWVFKLAAFNVALALMWLIYRLGFTGFDIKIKGILIPLAVAGVNAVFVIYDIALSKLIFIYITRISSRLNR